MAAARAAVGIVAVTGLGLPARRVGGALGVTGMAILRGLARGQEHLRRRGLDPERLVRDVLEKVIKLPPSPPALLPPNSLLDSAFMRGVSG